MKKFIGLMVLAFLLFSQAIFADEEFYLWTNQTFLPANGVAFGDMEIIATSPIIENQSDYSSLNIVMKYQGFIPDAKDGPVSYNVQVFIEGKMLANEWTPIYHQVNGINSIKDAPFRILTITPNFNNEYTSQFGANKLSQFYIIGGHLMKAFRVVIMNSDPTGDNPLTSITLRGFGRKFEREFVPAGAP